MKRYLSIFASVVLFLFVACEPPFMHPPTEQENTIWLATVPEMYFYVDYSEHMGTIGQTKNKLEIKLEFGRAHNVGVYDTNRFIYKYIPAASNVGISTKDALIFKGDCKFKETQLTITVTASEVDWVAVGDKIVFNRVEELPEWAAELESVTDE